LEKADLKPGNMMMTAIMDPKRNTHGIKVIKAAVEKLVDKLPPQFIFNKVAFMRN
jgi:hypothetical protein